ncbi:MAG: TatD family deoxyribonuclease [Clostridia bacterium]|nr:MAG: TatD family deoxyribonuclease [Clostridia bacterium]
MELIDSHAHLDDKQFAADLEAVLARAEAGGVKAIVTMGVNLASSRQAVALASRYPQVYAAVGIHPHEAAGTEAAVWGELRQLARSPKVVAIGEIGLDYHYHYPEPQVQQHVLRQQLDLAVEMGLPVVIHDREAHADIMNMLATSGYRERAGVVHCFSGDTAMARELINLGFCLSFPGTITFSQAELTRRVAAGVPLEAVLVETDCPYLSPVPYRGRRNEPARVREVAACLAGLRSLPMEEIAAITSANARTLFGVN